MKIFICTSKHLYDHVLPIKDTLEQKGHTITLPNSFDNPGREYEILAASVEDHKKWKAEMLRLQGEKIAANDAILVLNKEKHGQANYIGGATFLEMFKAFELNKKIFLFNPIPENFLKDEIVGMDPHIINGDLDLIG